MFEGGGGGGGEGGGGGGGGGGKPKQWRLNRVLLAKVVLYRHF